MKEIIGTIGIIILFIGTIASVITSIVFLKKKKSAKIPLICIPACIGVGFILLLIGISTSLENMFSMLVLGFGMDILFIGTIVSIIVAIIFFIKKKSAKIPLICIPVCIVFGFMIIMIGTDYYYENLTEEEIAKINEQKEKEEQEKAEKEKEKEEEKEEDKSDSTEKNKKTEEKESKNKENIKTEDDFITDFKTDVKENTAIETYDILKNKIGFSNLEYVGQLGDTNNYQITADGIDIVVTVIDDYYRIFIPESSYVFYEDGDVLMTAQELSEKTISNDDKIIYYLIAQDIVSQNLKNPKSANFPSINFDPQDIAIAKTGDIITVQSYVDAKNSFNAKVRSNYTVQFIVTDKGTYSYVLTYINIDGKSSGEYTEVN